MAADQGSVAVQSNLGDSYFRGLGVQRDYRGVAKWYTMAAKSDFPNAQNGLSELYRFGHGVQKDRTKAA